METSSDVPKSVSVFIENVEGIIQRNEGCIYSLFRTLCNIITYSKDDAQVHKIYNLGLQSLKDATKTIRSTLNPLEGTLIVHLTVFYHLEKFSQESLKELVLASMEVLNCEYFRHNKCMYGKYILSILQCLRIRFSETTQILTEFSMLDKFYSLVYDPGMYADSYDRKLYTISKGFIIQTRLSLSITNTSIKGFRSLPSGPYSRCSLSTTTLSYRRPSTWTPVTRRRKARNQW